MKQIRKLVLTTGIFPPDIGGPAFYTRELAGEFSRKGIKVEVVTYGKKILKPKEYKISGVSRLWPAGLRQVIYFWKVLARAKDSDAILAFDSLGAGLPAVLAGKILGKKVVMRLGGDFLWEKYIESGMEKVTMAEFYSKGLQQTYPILNRLIIFTLKRADFIAFTTNFQRDLFIKYYGLNFNKTPVISNIFEKKERGVAAYQDNPKIILWTGRFIKLKNLDFLLKVFNRLIKHDNNLVLELIGDGPEESHLIDLIREMGLSRKVTISKNLDEKFLFNQIQRSYFCILPSLSEVSPNFALRCLGFNKPIVLTQETGIKDQFPGLLYADPLKEDSFFIAALRLLDRNSYDNYQKFIANIRHEKTWQDLAEEYLQLLK